MCHCKGWGKEMCCLFTGSVGTLPLLAHQTKSMSVCFSRVKFRQYHQRPRLPQSALTSLQEAAVPSSTCLWNPCSLLRVALNILLHSIFFFSYQISNAYVSATFPWECMSSAFHLSCACSQNRHVFSLFRHLGFWNFRLFWLCYCWPDSQNSCEIICRVSTGLLGENFKKSK